MNIADFEKKKTLINKLSQDITKAEGAQEEIMKRLKADYGITSIEELEAKKKALSKEADEKLEDMNTLYAKLESLTNWEAL